MTLAEYVKSKGHGALAQLQREILSQGRNVAYSTLHAIKNGTVRPRPETAIAIEKATEGKVSAARLLGLEAA